MNEIYSWIKIPLQLFVTILVIKVIYSSLNIKKENEKILNVKENIKKKIERGEIWTSPMYNNSGFVIGSFLILITTFNLFIIKNINDFGFFLAILGLLLFGILMIWTTPVIHMTNKSIEFQPLLAKFLFANFRKKTISFENIQKIIKITIRSSPFISLQIYTKNSKKFKIYTHVFNSEIGNALYEVLLEQIK